MDSSSKWQHALNTDHPLRNFNPIARVEAKVLWDVFKWGYWAPRGEGRKRLWAFHCVIARAFRQRGQINGYQGWAITHVESTSFQELRDVYR